MMKRWSVSLLVAAVVAFGLVAQAGAAVIEVEGDAYVGVFDKYLWRGFDLSGGMPVAQAGADLSTHGFTLGYWSNLQLKGDDGLPAGEITETDIVVSYAHDFGDMLSVTVGDIWYQLEGIEDTNELFVNATVNTLLAPTVSMYYDWDAAEEDGLFFTFDVSHSLELMDSLTLNMGALVSYNLHSDYSIGDYSGFHNVEASISFDYALSDQFTISPSFVFSTPICSGAKDAIDTETLGGVTLTFAF
ncbi:hypothetical protein Pcar_1023 [Syntrophotalea carbinolica DSM 2380]|uniref:Uncharacterized protein n=1 Tax=Syntrophotalea carbinolica (strain DSM 2380 / NBRC 103641 / GraBd1) TaxID=338963 RepID=Q3A5T4_SYNC1|nr:TorF family putative porin [Syntrophotalea carbinolica]ABA88273.1 hypothetical protein Pcar_1023 [Syntrophotalea carbinolica DSM 2380]